MKKILTIDPGSRLGWAVGSTKTLKDYGLLTVPPLAEMETFLRWNLMGHHIDSLILQHKPDILVVEDVIKGCHTIPNWESRQWLSWTYGYVIHAGLVFNKGIQIVTVNPQTLKKHFNIQRGPSAKADMVRNVNERCGLSLTEKEHNQADAIAMWIWYKDTVL